MSSTSDRVLRPVPYARVATRPLASEAVAADSSRAAWLDAFRGFTMLCLVSRGFGVPRLAEFPWAKSLAVQFEHVDWRGITAWDLIQPFFMFIVGAAMPFAFAKRLAGGKSWASGLPHVLKRCLLLLFFSHLMSANDSGRWDWDFITVLSQIAFTYLVAYLVLPYQWTVQLAVAIGLLVVHWATHQFWPGVGAGGPWAKVQNFGEHLDRMLIGRNWRGDYATFNCVSAASATIAGVLAGNLLRSSLSAGRKSAVLLGVGVVLIAAGFALDVSGGIPMIKRIWTASFALASIGMTLIALLGFYLLNLAWERVPWGFLIAFGANCIFLYIASRMSGSHLRNIASRVLGEPLNWRLKQAGIAHADRWFAFSVDWAVLLMLIFTACWLYRRKIFFKL